MGPEADQDTAMAKTRLLTALRTFQTSKHPFQLLPDHGTPPPAAPRRCQTLVILDSSFNPPTLAHMHMATSAIQDLRKQQQRDRSVEQNRDVRLLLLLAVNNADKAPKPAAFEERLLMMETFRRDVRDAWQRIDDEWPAPDIDVGLTTLPYFHDKSAAIAASPDYEHTSSGDDGEPQQQTKQVFLAGYDTLIRIFTPKYYTSPVPEAEVDPPEPNKTPIQVALDPFFARAQLRVTMRTDDDWGGREDQLGYIERILHGKELEEVGGRREWARRVELVEGTKGDEGGVVSSTLAREAVKAKDWGRLRELVPGEVARLVEEDAVAW